MRLRGHDACCVVNRCAGVSIVDGAHNCEMNQTANLINLFGQTNNGVGRTISLAFSLIRSIVWRFHVAFSTAWRRGAFHWCAQWDPNAICQHILYYDIMKNTGRQLHGVCVRTLHRYHGGVKVSSQTLSLPHSKHQTMRSISTECSDPHCRLYTY